MAQWNLTPRKGLVCLLVAAVWLVPASVWRVAKASAQAAASSPALALELNKLEPLDKNCRAFFVIDNPGSTAYPAYKIDLVLFQPDGVIGRRVALDLAPLKSAKRTVKQFDFEGLTCEKIGSVLVNDVVECKGEASAPADCLSAMTVKSLVSGVKFEK
jgi:hypothetical protein